MAELNISERQIDDITILDLDGDVTFGQGNLVLRIAIRRLLSEDKKKILLNFCRVRFVDSSGIGELVSGLVVCDREGGQLKLINLRQATQYLLEVTKLLRVFDIYENETDALNSYSY